MKLKNYQLNKPVDAVVFDCDGTLSAIEGIEVLAQQNGVGERVKILTHRAMSESGLTSEIYEERLQLVQPSRQQVVELAQAYFSSRVHQVASVITLLQSQGKAVFVVSAGINPAVKLFAAMLDVPMHHVFAVDVQFTLAGKFDSYDADCPCSTFQGKRKIAQKIKQAYPRLVWVGDGMNDVAVKAEVVRFVGFGGYKYRKKVAAMSDFYLTSVSMASLLPLVLTAEEVSCLSGSEKSLYEEGMSRLEAGEIE